MPLILILLLAVFQCSITNYLIMNPDYYQLGPYTWESGEVQVNEAGNRCWRRRRPLIMTCLPHL